MKKIYKTPIAEVVDIELRGFLAASIIEDWGTEPGHGTGNAPGFRHKKVVDDLDEEDELFDEEDY